jgi:hypothetical protein
VRHLDHGVGWTIKAQILRETRPADNNVAVEAGDETKLFWQGSTGRDS